MFHFNLQLSMVILPIWWTCTRRDQYETSYDSYPVNLDLSDPMYLQVKVVSNDYQLVIIPIKFWATPEPNPEASESYTFIKDGNEMQPTFKTFLLN